MSPPLLVGRRARAPFAGAGLAAGISDVVNDAVLTFLRRADRHPLGSVRRGDVERAFRVTVESAGRNIDADALDVMVDGANGYPFLLQPAASRTPDAGSVHSSTNRR